MSETALSDTKQDHLHLEPVGQDQHFIGPITGDHHTPVKAEHGLSQSIIKTFTDSIEMIETDFSQSMFALLCQLCNSETVYRQCPEQVDNAQMRSQPPKHRPDPFESRPMTGQCKQEIMGVT
jgi:hypothetical protein